MKYKLLKDLPGIKAGEIMEMLEDCHPFNEKYVSHTFANSHPDFFEPIVEKRTIHDLKKSDACFMIDRYGNVDSTTFNEGVHFLCLSNRFISTKEAEDEHKRREYSVRPDKFIPKEGEYYYRPGDDGIVYQECNFLTALDVLLINSGLAFRTREDCEKAIKEHDLVNLFYTIR